LWLVTLVDERQPLRLLHAEAVGGGAVNTVGSIERAVPESLRHIIEQHLRHIDPGDRTFAMTHLTRALGLLAALPETPERRQQELALPATLGPALMAIKGYAAPEVAHAYARAHALCQQVGDTSQRFPVLLGLCTFYQERAELQTAYGLAEQLLQMAQDVRDPVALLWAHSAMGVTLHFMGQLVQARAHLEESLTFSPPGTSLADGFVFDPGVDSRCTLAEVLYLLGYPEKALQCSQEGLDLARELAHPFNLAAALGRAAHIHRVAGGQRQR
jgi:tetratricopeptide (TPR) repeat protein